MNLTIVIIFAVALFFWLRSLSKEKKPSLIVESLSYSSSEKDYSPTIVSFSGSVGEKRVSGRFKTTTSHDWGELAMNLYEGESSLSIDGSQETSETAQLFVEKHWYSIKKKYEEKEEAYYAKRRAENEVIWERKEAKKIEEEKLIEEARKTKEVEREQCWEAARKTLRNMGL